MPCYAKACFVKVGTFYCISSHMCILELSSCDVTITHTGPQSKDQAYLGNMYVNIVCHQKIYVLPGTWLANSFLWLITLSDTIKVVCYQLHSLLSTMVYHQWCLISLSVTVACGRQWFLFTSILERSLLFLRPFLTAQEHEFSLNIICQNSFTLFSNFPILNEINRSFGAGWWED